MCISIHIQIHIIRRVMRATVKQFMDGLEEMRKIYPFEDDKTYMGTENIESRQHNRLSIYTVDEKTKIQITMEKYVSEIH